MAERPIIMSGASVRAILAGMKTQTRRKIRFPVWAAGCFDDPLKIEVETDDHGHFAEVICNDTGCLAALPLPYRVGDSLWVRETHRFRGATYLEDSDPEPEWFRVRSKDGDSWDPEFPDGWSPKRFSDATEPADQEDDAVVHLTPWISPIHMPRWASRLTLTVTDVRVQRLQDISEADAREEGLACLSKDDGKTWKYGMADRDGWPGTDDDGWPWEDWYVDPRIAYARLWNSIHGPSAWDANPWVAAITFERTAPIPAEGGA